MAQQPAEARFSEAVEGELDSLYREHPDGFVAGRNELAKKLAAEGEREAAARLRRLRRPSPAAWLINRIRADDPERIENFTAAADELGEAQRRVLEQGADPAELRAAAARERDQTDDLVGEARRVAGTDGREVSETVIARVADTLRAVGSDPELRGQVLRGRVERERTAATVGIPSSGSPRRPARREGRSTAKDVERARKELERLRADLDAAEARRERGEGTVRDAEDELRKAKGELAEANRDVRELSRSLNKAERKASGNAGAGS